MATAVLRAVRIANPRVKMTFYTAYPELVYGLSYIDRIVESRNSSSCPLYAINLSYEECLPPSRHIARVMGERLGVIVRDVRPDCVRDERRVAEYRERWAAGGRPVVVANRRAGPWTPNKDWPDAYWSDLLERLCRWATVVEVGAPDPTAWVPKADVYHDLRGRTTVPDMVAAVAAADVHVGPISGPVHVAAAVGVPAVVIYGGYEHPVCSRYPGNVDLYTPLHCSPCWLRTPCPIGRECLTVIRPERVEQAVRSLVGRRR